MEMHFIPELAGSIISSEHTTTVDGNGKNPGKKELVAVGVQAGMKKTYCERVAEEIRLCVNEKLEHYLK